MAATVSRRAGRAWIGIVAALGVIFMAAVVVVLLARGRTPDSVDQVGNEPTKPPEPEGNFSFTEVTDEWGIAFRHEPGPASFFFPEIVGSGVAIFDFDRDGRLDIYLRTGTAAPPHPRASADSPRAQSRLFHQQSDGLFVDVTESSGLGDTGYGMGVSVGDVNNDGFPEVYVANFGGDRLYLNNRDGTFSDITESAQLGNGAWGSSACFFDFDRDGRLDLFVTNYVDYSNPKACMASNGREDYCNPSEFAGSSDRLYRNVTDVSGSGGAVRFEDVSESSGIGSQRGPGLGVRPGDFDRDGWPDLYVANDGRPNFMWMNGRDGTFRDVAVPLGTAYSSNGRPTASMGIAEADVDGDGEFDLLVTNLRAEGSTLYRRTAAGHYQDASNQSNLLKLTLPHTGFGVALADLDHDGDSDCVQANGHVYQPLEKPLAQPPRESDAAALERFWKSYADRSQVMRNDGRGRFEEVSSLTGSFGTAEEPSRGLALGDLDGDGDLDLVVTNTAGPTRVFRNDVEKLGHWLLLQVVDPAKGGRDSYGAFVTVTAGERRWIARVQPASSYQSSDDSRLHFGLGSAEKIDSIEVQWPDGDVETEVFPGGLVDTLRLIRRGEGERR